MTLPPTPSRRALHAYFALGVFAGGVFALAVILRQLA